MRALSGEGRRAHHPREAGRGVADEAAIGVTAGRVVGTFEYETAAAASRPAQAADRAGPTVNCIAVAGELIDEGRVPLTWAWLRGISLGAI